ncbi:Methyltransferase domain-containing protein [Georgenia satyanarayanai]|uniref:Methyltransferase domain-containing protein n=1 Tax=Georgenia satyanarayanai TaxID=860221 RepID=A0A2Y8ZXN7_9MICO|nr:class I SAM-dependent methyltransferase [Georgenia satyanarayanai]PYG01942.1 methyltransferase family protein [Georgenia satyanarayanai]SSA36745.1 Methyltransferase domain-containing protein [Georgenia satyanarayanai]
MTTAHRHEHAAALVVSAGPAVVLEIGCGNGAVLELLAERLPQARLIGLDRSATALARAAGRLREQVAAGRVTLVQAAIVELGLPAASVDVAVAVNVNVFWTSSAAAELAVLARVLRPGGELHLVVAPPSPDPRVRAGTEGSLRRAGWTTTAVAEHGGVVAVSATPG